MSTTQLMVKDLVKRNGRTRNSLMPVLQGIVQEENFLSEEAMLSVAEELDISVAEVYSTASFYTFLDTVPRGKNIIRVCKTITCHMKGKDEIINALSNALKIKVGETTSDKQFTLLTANCLGWCHKGPVMLINDDIYPDLTVEKALDIIGAYSQKPK
ncbi:MAG: NAD(P)H-dependent oxidoreductase subunit E [Lentimicrobium sp.]|jgi:NADH:ubiquinone oxidoreductase subunit E|nr:NAD(P)H-dependent oxidoreductase subunit E [Lentimicrobium sp.]MDD2526532.1 NAD(P)H-dependent oxidoreductase subunit E [Lentimicrobiaceae bacterium]MDD4596334.1 NAD(P)H-dependent oxidoreductase subunit E [Lentimicrobiaceae bacterium]MDY0025543.1 NAD(P)H-dependent oxidoreductase subunit E [Lentimicrobium sp.]HAH58294.1 NAD(P)H-dependent oxidoreductase subunit E [Bacteroidales bacterium]